MEHPADVGFRARGATLEQCFEAAADALNEFGWQVEAVKEKEEIEVRARAGTLEDLMFSWLSEILYLNDGEQWLFRRFEIREVVEKELPAEPQRDAEEDSEPGWELVATARGEKFDETRHAARTCVKAITYHQLSVQQKGNVWEATVYIDV